MEELTRDRTLPMTNTAVDEIQVDIDEAKEVVAEAEALERLEKNPDFRKIITKGLFEDEAARLVSLKAAPQMQSEQQQRVVMGAIEMIGGLQHYFNKIRIIAGQVQMAIEQSEAALAELAEEGDL